MRRSGSLAVLGALTLGLAGCGLGLPPAGNYASLTGIVSDASSGAAIPGAIVTVNGVLTAQTDAKGAYHVPVIPTGPWSYAVSAPGYVTAQSDQPDQLGPGEKRTFSVKLVPAKGASSSSGSTASPSSATASPAPSPSASP